MNVNTTQIDCCVEAFSRRIRPVLFLLIVVFQVACSDIKNELEPKSEPQPVPIGRTYIRFRISLAKPNALFTRAEEIGESIGSDNENTIRSFYVFIFDQNFKYITDIDLTGKVENNTEYLYSSDNLVLKSGSQYMVALANLTPEQYDKLKAMVENFDSLPAEEKNYYKYMRMTIGSGPSMIGMSRFNDVINYFARNSDGRQQKLESDSDGCIQMQAVGTSDSNSSSFDLSVVYSKDNPLDVNFELTRSVAKVHLLYTDTETSGGVDFIKTYQKADETNVTNINGGIGFIRADSIFYTVNSMNREIYLISKEADQDKYPKLWYEDPNMDLAEVMQKIDSKTYRYDQSKLDEHFVYIPPQDYGKLTDAQFYSHFERAEKLDNAKLYRTNHRQGGGYVKGVYTLPNVYGKPTVDQTDANNLLANNLVSPVRSITHLQVACRLMPRELYVDRETWNYVKDPQNTYLTDEERGFMESLFHQSTTGDGSYFHEDVFMSDRGVRLAEGSSKANFELDCVHIDFGRRFKVAGETTVEENKTDNELGLYNKIERFLSLCLKVQNEYRDTGTAWQANSFTPGSYWTVPLPYTNETGKQETKYYFITERLARRPGSLAGVRNRIVTHVGGWCYFFSYIEDYNVKKKEDIVYVSPSQSYVNAQLLRNTYYLPQLRRITVPGNGDDGGTYIEVNTVSIGWGNGGEGKTFLD